MEVSYRSILMVLFCVNVVQQTEAAKKMGGPTNCYDCVFQQTKCIKTCMAKYDCTKNVVKEGFCPYGGAVVIKNCPKISTLSSCETDNDCAGSKKCCNNGCRRLCSTPLPFPPPTVSETSFRQRRYGTRRSRYTVRVWNPRRKAKPRRIPFRIPKTVPRATTTTTTTTTTTEKPPKFADSDNSKSVEAEDSRISETIETETNETEVSNEDETQSETKNEKKE